MTGRPYRMSYAAYTLRPWTAVTNEDTFGVILEADSGAAPDSAVTPALEATQSYRTLSATSDQRPSIRPLIPHQRLATTPPQSCCWFGCLSGVVGWFGGLVVWFATLASLSGRGLEVPVYR